MSLISHGEFTIIVHTVISKSRLRTLKKTLKKLLEALKTLKVYRCLDITVRDIAVGSRSSSYCFAQLRGPPRWAPAAARPAPRLPEGCGHVREDPSVLSRPFARFRKQSGA